MCLKGKYLKKENSMIEVTPYIENGKWKLFDKTYPEQTEADKIIFDGFFNTIKKHYDFLCTDTQSRSFSDTETQKISQSSNSSPTMMKKLSTKPLYHMAIKYFQKQ